MRAVALVAVLLVATLGPPAPLTRAASRKELPKVFKSIEKFWKKGKVDKITALLPAKGKVKLALLEFDAKKYSHEQATALLEKYFDSIETKEFELDDGPHGTSAQYKHTFKVKKNRCKVERDTFITLDRENDRWVIVEIIED